MSGIFFAELPPDELLNRTEHILLRSSIWIENEKSELLHYVLISLTVIAVGVLLIYSGRILAKKLGKSDSWRWDLVNSMFVPLVWCGIFSGIFFAFLPLR